ncbi:MAG: hypothetical protein OHK0039_38440 [Bacteroidia bacterium]
MTFLPMNLFAMLFAQSSRTSAALARGRWLLGGAAILALLLVCCLRRPTEYLSLDPANSYTGSASCEPCHRKIYHSYLETGMGKSLYPPSPDRIIEDFGPSAVVYHPATDFYYRPYWSGDRMMLLEYRLEGGDTVFRRTEQVDYVVGSGHQTRSYLMLRNGYLYEMPVTWYVHRQIWDMSPGYDVNNSRFDREIGIECMACHTGYIDPVAGSKNRYRYLSEGIDCEKCHGPGAAHIRLTEAGQLIDVGEEIDYSIVNPAKLPLDRQFDVCQQCHLQGVNVYRPGRDALGFRPAMALDSVWEVFVEEMSDSNAFGIASHAERLQQSRCFVASAGQLTCATCHDPHQGIARTDTLHFVRQCQQCHQGDRTPVCAAPPATQATMQGNCVSCHMPAGGTRDIPHVFFHDHRIRIVAGTPDTLPVERIAAFVRLRGTRDDGSAGRAWLRYFEQQDPRPAYLDSAGVRLGPGDDEARARLAYYRGDHAAALELIDRVLSRQPGDAYAHFLRGEVLAAAGRYAEAEAAFRQAWEQEPESVEAGLKTAVNLLKARPGVTESLDRAAAIFEHLRTQKPFDTRVLTNLGFVYLNQGQADRAEAALVEALGYDPDDRQALENMVLLQLLRGNARAAQRYFDHLAARHPAAPQLEALRGRIAALGH